MLNGTQRTHDNNFIMFALEVKICLVKWPHLRMTVESLKKLVTNKIKYDFITAARA